MKLIFDNGIKERVIAKEMQRMLHIMLQSVRENSEIDREYHRDQHEEQKREIEDIGKIKLELSPARCSGDQRQDHHKGSRNTEYRNDVRLEE